MKTFKLPDLFTTHKRILTAAACFFTGVLTCSATVTVQGWWHLDSTQPITDSSGNSRTFGSAYSTAPATGGAVAAQLINNGASGPLGSTGWISTECVRVGVGVGGKRQSSMWGLSYNPPAQNFGIEAWVLPQGNGIAGGSGGWILSSGSSGGVSLRINENSTNSWIDAFDVGNGAEIGDQAPIDTNQWMHIAIVNVAGVTTFYTNGVPCGLSLSNATTTSAGDAYAFSAPGDNSAFYGYADEMRMFTFAAGAFSTNDLLLRPPGPKYIVAPQNAAVWDGGAAPFAAIASFDNFLAYQWQSNGISVDEATNSTYVLPTVAPADSGSTFDCIMTASGLSVTSTPPAILTVVPVNTSNVLAYQNLVQTTPGILAYFPVDFCTTSVLTNVVDATHDGLLENNANYDGRTNRSFGQRALSFNVDGDVEVPYNAAYEFPSGNGTIEALVYLNQATVENATIFSENVDGGLQYYSLAVDPSGGFLVYHNDATTTNLTWSVPGGMAGQFVHVALVINNLTNVTPYVNGQSLGTEQQPSFGSAPGGSFWIGGIGNDTTDNRWAGTIDELAIYGTSLSAATIQSHYTKYVYGTNNVPPSIVSQPSSKTLLAGGSPVLTVAVSGALPFTFQWTSNSVPIAGATSSTFVLPQTTTNSSATYSLSVQNVFGTTNTQPIVLTFVAPPAGYVANIMADNPTALWRLAETNGLTAVDSAGLNDATYTSTGVTYAAGGPPGDTNAGALFDGASGRAVTPAIYSDINPSGPFTIEFWGNLASYGFFVPLGSMDRVLHPRAGGYEWYIDGNSPGYEFHTAENAGYSLLCADNNVPPDGTWAYLTGVWDGTTLYLYVNGQLGNNQIDSPAPAGTDNFTAEGLGQTAFVPNTSAPFIIGSRDDNTHYYHGTISDVAFYNYALTQNQITSHWSYAWSPAQVVSAPLGVTNVEGSTITLAPTVKGLPNTYQWYFNGNPLDSTVANAPDNTLHYPSGVTSTSLVISEAKPADSGEYYLQIMNPIGGTVSANINVVVTPNTNPPAVEAVIPLGTPNTVNGTLPNLVKVVFTGRVDYSTGSDPSKYTFNPPLTVSTMTLLGAGSYDVAAASLGADWREAILTTSGLTPGQKYTLKVSGVKDQSATPLTIPDSTNSFFAPVLTPGLVNWDYYYLGTGGGTVGALTGNQYYPSAPQTNAYLTVFDTDQITGGDLNNNPTFGGLGDNYGDVTSGWLTPTVSGYYTFFLWTDDGGELDMSPDSNPNNASEIASEPGADSGFVETNTATTQDSSPILLTAGQSYFIRILHSEGGGGDYAKVAWRISTDSTPAKNLTPIPGSFFSAYASGAPKFNAPVLSGGKLTLSWGEGTIQQSTDLLNWANVPGNPNPLVVPVTNAAAMFFRLIQ